jgi:hypothetical protein
MPTPSISDETLQEAAELYLQHGSIRAAANAAGVARTTFWERLKRASERGLVGFRPVLPGFRVSRIATTVDAAGNVKSETVQQNPELGEVFEVPPGQVIKELSVFVDPADRIIHKWIKTKPDAATSDLVAALKSVFSEYSGKAELIEAPRQTDRDFLSVYPIADQHNGLLSWGRETGESYDLKIGAERLRGSMARLIGQSPPSEQAIILNLGDWQHTDDSRNMTPRGGNILDVDSRYFKILTTGVHLMMDCIELALQKHASILVRNLPGNHDPHASIALTVALGAFYSNNPRVVIDQNPAPFFFHRFGASLIGATHGHMLRPDKMAMVMAVNRREDWGATKYHYFYHGHIHHERVVEVGDVRVESFQTLAAKDAFDCVRLHVRTVSDVDHASPRRRRDWTAPRQHQSHEGIADAQAVLSSPCT